MTFEEYVLSPSNHFEIDFEIVRERVRKYGEYYSMNMEEWHHNFKDGFDTVPTDMIYEPDTDDPFLDIEGLIFPLSVIKEVENEEDEELENVDLYRN